MWATSSNPFLNFFPPGSLWSHIDHTTTSVYGNFLVFNSNSGSESEINVGGKIFKKWLCSAVKMISHRNCVKKLALNYSKEKRLMSVGLHYKHAVLFITLLVIQGYRPIGLAITIVIIYSIQNLIAVSYTVYTVQGESFNIS